MVTSVRLPEELERAVLAYAQRHDVSKSTAMRMLMENGLAREGLSRDVTDLEERLTAMEETLTQVASALEELQMTIDDGSAPRPNRATVDGVERRSQSHSDTPAPRTGRPEPEPVATIPGGPETAPDGTRSASDDATEQAPIAQWHDGSTTPKEVTDGGQPADPSPTEQS